MPSFPTFPNLDLTNFDLSRVKVPKVPNLNLSGVNLSNVSIPNVSIPNVNLPELNLPTVNTGQIDVDRALGVARDAAYVGIGLTVLAIQQTQVRRRELQKDLERTVRAVKERIA